MQLVVTIVHAICRYGLALILITAAAAKMLRWQEWMSTIDMLDFFQSRYSQAVAIAVPMTELAIALALLITTNPVAAAAAIGLFLGFAGVLVPILLRPGPRTQCGCFGKSGRMGWHILVRDLGLGLAAASLLSTNAMSFLVSLIACGIFLISLTRIPDHLATER